MTSCNIKYNNKLNKTMETRKVVEKNTDLTLQVWIETNSAILCPKLPEENINEYFKSGQIQNERVCVCVQRPSTNQRGERCFMNKTRIHEHVQFLCPQKRKTQRNSVNPTQNLVCNLSSEYTTRKAGSQNRNTAWHVSWFIRRQSQNQTNSDTGTM